MQVVATMPHWLPLLLASVASATLCLALVLTKRWHGRLTLDHTDGCQKFHTAPTPRVGGIGILGGLLAFAVLTPSLSELLVPLVCAGLPAFIAGLGEDVTRRVGVPVRLAATVLSGLIACLASGLWLSGVDVPGVDLVLAFPLFAIPITAVALAGVANAVNMIDGFNGLAGGAALIIAVALGVMAAVAGDEVLARACFGLAAVLVGFLAVNFPAGKIFLGDGGAYFLGFALGWLTVLLVERNPAQVSPWAGLLVCGYPVLEMFFSMWRKTRREGAHMSRPDRLHLHMLINQRVIRHAFPKASPLARNALTSPACWVFSLVTVTLAVLFMNSGVLLAAGFLLSAALYGAVYTRIAKFRWVSPALRPSPRVSGVAN